MTVAATSELLVKIIGSSNLAGVVAKDEAALGRFGSAATRGNTSVNALVGASGKASKAMVGLGGALGHAGSKIGGLLTGPLGLIGLTGGILGLGGAIESSVHKVEDFGLGLEKLQGLTGETAQSAGTLILLFDKYGLSVDRVSQIAGFTEKTLGKLNATQAKGVTVGKSAELQNLELVKAQRQAAGESTKAINKLITEQKARDQITAAQQKTVASVTKLAALDKQYGLQLLDSKGKVASFSQVLAQLADLYDRKNVPASTKAYVAAQVLGRGYAALIPILTKGSEAIREASKEADGLGLSNSDTAEKMIKFRDTMRNLGETVNVLQMRIGLALVPAITNAAQAVSDWLGSGGDTQIVDFFKGGAKFAGEMGHAIETWIVPAFKAITAGWNAVPGPLKDLLIGGFVANKIGKSLFDKSLFSGAKGLLGSLLGKVPVIGGALDTAAGGVQHVWVDNPGFGGLNPTNIIPEVTAAAGGITAATVASATAAFTIALAPVAAALLILGTRSQESADKADYASRLATAAARGIPLANVPGPGERAGGPLANAFGAFQQNRAIPADQRNPDRFDRAMFDAVKAGAYAGTNNGIIHNASLFHKAQAVRDTAGTRLSRDVLIADLHKPGKLTTGDLVTAQAVALAALNHVRMDKNPDLRSAAANLALIKRTEAQLPAELAGKLKGPIHSLEVAINATTAAINAKQFTATVQNYREGPSGDITPKTPLRTPGHWATRPNGNTYWVDGKARGGPVTGGRSYLVGERGPELFSPGRDGTIIPNQDLHRRQGTGGTGQDIDPNSLIKAIAGWFFGSAADQARTRANQWDPSSGISKGDWAHGLRRPTSGNLGRSGPMTLHANVSISTREVNTAQAVRLRHGPTPTQVGGR